MSCFNWVKSTISENARAIKTGLISAGFFSAGVGVTSLITGRENMIMANSLQSKINAGTPLDPQAHVNHMRYHGGQQNIVAGVFLTFGAIFGILAYVTYLKYIKHSGADTQPLYDSSDYRDTGIIRMPAEPSTEGPNSGNTFQNSNNDFNDSKDNSDVVVKFT